MTKAWFSPTLKIKTSIIFISVLFVLILIKSLLFAPSTVGVVDVNHIKGQFIRSLANHQLPIKKARAATALFNKALQKSLQDYGRSHGLVLVKKEGVLFKNGKTNDVTNTLLKDVVDNMRKLSHV